MDNSPQKMPVLFVGHGSPMNIVADNDFTRALSAWGRRLPRPNAILCVSAHWLAGGTLASCTAKPNTIHDFYGFPQKLYSITYPCPGAPDEADFVSKTVRKTQVGHDPERGIDHGTWSVLLHMFPDADIPVFQLSIDYTFNDWNPKPMRYHYELAKELSELRQRGVLIIGSGNIVHNLSRIDWNTDAGAENFPWAVEFDTKVKDCLLAGDHDALIDYKNLGPSAALSVPTPDHYLPMLYSIALQEPGDNFEFTFEGFQNGSLSMRCFQIG